METEKISVWRLHTKTESDHGKQSIGNYIIKQNIAAMGWGYSDHEPRSELNFHSFDEYKQFVAKKENGERYYQEASNDCMMIFEPMI